MERKFLDSKKRGRETEEASSSSTKKSRFLRSLIIPDVPPKSSDQPHKLDLSKREIGESSTKDHTRIEIPKESKFEGEIHKVLIRYHKAMQESNIILQSKWCSILSEGKFAFQLKEIRQALDTRHTTCIEAGNNNHPLAESYEKFKDTLHEYDQIIHELRTTINTKLKTLIPTSSWEVSSIDSLKSLGTHICQNIREILSNKEIDMPYRCKILNAIALSGNKNGVSALVEALSDPQIELNMVSDITRAIVALGDKGVVPSLVQVLSNHQIARSVHCMIVVAIENLADQDVLPDLFRTLSNPQLDSGVHYQTARAIGEIARATGTLDKEHVVPSLEQALSNHQIDKNARCEIIRAIETLDDKDVVLDLFQRLSNHQIDDKEVHNAINKAIKALKRKMLYQT